MKDERIDEHSLAVITPGPRDYLRVVEGATGASRRARMDTLPPPAGVEERLTTVEMAQASGVVGFGVKASMDAALNYPAGTLAMVTNDAEPANNGTYRKRGAVGSGDWVKSADRINVIADKVSSGSLELNRGANFPLRPMLRDNGTGAVVSPPHPDFNRLLLQIRVVGAERGKFYRIWYFRNGATIGGEQTDGWSFEEIDASTFETTSPATFVHTYLDPAPDIDRSKGLQTIIVEAARKPGLEFHITLDATQLLPYGTFYFSRDKGEPAWSWIIDPSQYEYRESAQAVDSSLGGGVYYSYDHGTGLLRYAYRSGDWLYRINFGPNGYNNLPNLIGVDRAPGTDSVESAAWTTLATTTTDYLPPLTFRAAANGDGGPLIYTGGNHGADGSSGGGQTARNLAYRVHADGAALIASGSGYAQQLTILVVNELMAYNTITLNRYPLRQSFGINASSHGLEVHSEVFAREALELITDNGIQVAFGGFNTSQLMLGGQNTTRVPLDTSISSGPKSSYPNAWAIVMKSIRGQMVAWMDRDYEAGDGRYVAAGDPLIRGPGAGRGKFYHAVVTEEALLAAGASYRWRGGYHYCADTAPSGFDCVFTISKNSCPATCFGLPDGQFMVLP